MFNKIGKLLAVVLVIYSFAVVINVEQKEQHLLLNASEVQQDLLSNAPGVPIDIWSNAPGVQIDEVEIDGSNGTKLKIKEYRKNGVLVSTVTGGGNTNEDWDAVIKYASEQPGSPNPPKRGIALFVDQQIASFVDHLCGITRWDFVKEGVGYRWCG